MGPRSPSVGAASLPRQRCAPRRPMRGGGHGCLPAAHSLPRKTRSSSGPLAPAHPQPGTNVWGKGGPGYGSHLRVRPPGSDLTSRPERPPALCVSLLGTRVPCAPGTATENVRVPRRAMHRESWGLPLSPRERGTVLLVALTPGGGTAPGRGGEGRGGQGRAGEGRGGAGRELRPGALQQLWGPFPKNFVRQNDEKTPPFIVPPGL